MCTGTAALASPVVSGIAVGTVIVGVVGSVATLIGSRTSDCLDWGLEVGLASVGVVVADAGTCRKEIGQGMKMHVCVWGGGGGGGLCVRWAGFVNPLNAPTPLIL